MPVRWCVEASELALAYLARAQQDDVPLPDRPTSNGLVQVIRKKAHPFYGSVVSNAKQFYAHDEQNEAHIGDVVRLEETRPLSKLKRWRLKEVMRKTALVPEVPAADVETAR